MSIGKKIDFGIAVSAQQRGAESAQNAMWSIETLSTIDHNSPHYDICKRLAVGYQQEAARLHQEARYWYDYAI